MDILECVICVEKLHPKDQYILVLNNFTQHTGTPLQDIIGNAIRREVKVADIMCKKCLDLFNEKDRLQKMATDMDNHILTKIKDSSKKNGILSNAISITVGETLGNGTIKEELERQYKTISLGELNSDSIKGNLTELTQIGNRKKRGRPRKVTVVSNEENTEPPPLMVNERQKRKRSDKFNTFLEVLKGEKDFYIMDDMEEEPRVRRKKVSLKHKRTTDFETASISNDSTSIQYEMNGESASRMCIIQLTEMEDQSLIAMPSIDKDSSKFNLSEVVDDILRTDVEESSLIQDIDPMAHVDDDLIKDIDAIDTQQDDRTEDEIVLNQLNLSDDDICMKKEPIDIDDTWHLVEYCVSNTDSNLLKESSTSSSLQSSSIVKIEKPNDSDASIVITDVENAGVLTDVEVTILHNDDDTLCAVVNTQDIVDDFSEEKLELEKKAEMPSVENFRCKLCSKIFPSKDIAREHAQTEHRDSIPMVRDNAFKCMECSKSFPTLKGCHRHHSQMHLKYKPVQCEECNITFNSFRPLERHLRNDHDKDPTFHCQICDAEFVLESSLKLHSEIGHPSMPKRSKKKLKPKTKVGNKNKYNRLFKCPLCDKQIYGVRAIKSHHKKYHNNVDYTCKFCKRKSNCLSTYDRHMVKVHKASTLQLYNCIECRRGFQTPRDIEEHHITYHNAKLTHLCPSCGEKFACIPMLKFHRKSHVAFSCKVCHLGFMKEEALEDHVKTVHVSDSTASDAFVGGAIDENPNAKSEIHKPVGKETNTGTKTKEPSAKSKIFVIGSDGSVKIKEEKENSTVPPVPPEDVTLHLQQSREGGLEEMDIFNPLKGQKVKDLPKKMCCPICNKLLTTKFLRTHMLSHKGELPHKCKVCGKSYAQGTLLRKHMKNRHYEEFLKMGNKHPKKQKVSCEFCQKVYDDVYTLEEHLWDHMDVKTFECNDCKIKFGMESNLREHYKSHYFKEVKFCPVCKREFKSIGFYNDHVEKCENRWKCDYCGLECFTEEYYRKHQKSEHGGENVVRFQCTNCEKSFVERHRYEDHLITHSSKKAFTCYMCNKQFKRFRPLKDHIVRCHSNRPLTCSYCRKSFSSQEELDVHKKTHKKALSCALCGLLYTSKESLANHVVVDHSEDNPHNCHICNQSFVKPAHLKAHMVTHNSYTPNICPVDGCQKMFRSEALLRNHVTRRHHELQYVCPICDRTFGLESDQIRHMTTHKKSLQPYLTCILCSSNFKTEALLDRHLLTHTDEKPYECRVCDHKAVARFEMVLHIQEEHGILEVAPSNIIVKRWRCSGCRKMFMVQASLIRHLEEHASNGIHAEGFSVKTFSSSVSDITSGINVDTANTASAFIDQISALSWQDITSLLHMKIISEDGGDANISPSNVWQCPGCLLVTQREEDMRDHLISTSSCQEAVVLHMADGLENSDDILEGNEDKNESGEGEQETVLQLTNGECGLQYVIVQEGETTTKYDTIKGENEGQEDEESMPILVSMDDSIQHLLHQPGTADIQIVVEGSAPLKQLLERGENDSTQGGAIASTSSTNNVQNSLQESTDLLNGCEVLLQTADGKLLLQQTVGGVTQYQLLEGVPAAVEEEESSLALIQSSSPIPASEFIDSLQSECL